MKKQGILIAIVVTLFVALLAVLAYFLVLSPPEEAADTVETAEETDGENIEEGSDNEIAETVKTIKDRRNRFSIDVPDNWLVEKEGSKGVRVSQTVLESPDFAFRQEAAEGPHDFIFYEDGFQLTITVFEGVATSTQEPVGIISEELEVTVDGKDLLAYRYVEPSTELGEILEVRFAHRGESYVLRFVYNPEENPNGEELFRAILSTFELQ